MRAIVVVLWLWWCLAARVYAFLTVAPGVKDCAAPAEQAEFCGAVFSAVDMAAPARPLDSEWSSVCRRSDDCKGLPQGFGPTKFLQPETGPAHDCLVPRTLRVRMLPSRGVPANLVRDRFGTYSLVRLRMPPAGSWPRTASDCAPDEEVFASVWGLDGLPGFFGPALTSCPTCAVPAQCDDGPSGVGCCQAASPRGGGGGGGGVPAAERCVCPAGTTASLVGCNAACKPGQRRCNDQGDCEVAAGRTTVDAQAKVVPWTSANICACRAGFFGADCSRTCTPACDAAHGRCVVVADGGSAEAGAPRCLCEFDWGGAACTTPLAPCFGGAEGGTSTLCHSRGLCRT